MATIGVICRRELYSYFATPLAYIFICIFLALAGALTFFVGNFLERGIADLQPFFQFHPWLYLLLIPALSMRLWAEERKSGTIELLLTLPVSTFQAVLGKFLAAWLFTAIAVVLTFPMWITVNWLGEPDNGVILAAYLGSLLMAGGYLAIGATMSALTRNQVIAFVLAVAVSFLLTVAGTSFVQNFLGSGGFAEAVRNLAVLTHFNAIERGVLDLRDIVYFAGVIALFLFANTLAVSVNKAG